MKAMLTSSTTQPEVFSPLFAQTRGSSFEDGEIAIPDRVLKQVPKREHNGFRPSSKQVAGNLYDVDGNHSSYSYPVHGEVTANNLKSSTSKDHPSDSSLNASHAMNDEKNQEGIVRKQVKPKRLQASTLSAQNVPVNGGFVRRLAAKNAMACVNAMFDPVRKKRHPKKGFINPDSSEIEVKVNPPSLLSPDNTDILTRDMSRHGGMSDVLGKRKQPENSSSNDTCNTKKRKQEIQKKKNKPRIPSLAELADDSFSIESSSSSSSSPTSFTESDLACTESITSTTSDESRCVSDCSEYCDSIPFSKSGLLYNGDCIHSSTRFYLKSDSSIANRIIPIVVPKYFDTKLKTEALEKSAVKKRSQKGDNGWVPIGSPIKTIDIKMEGGKKLQRRYYIGIKRKQEKVFARDSILLKSGKRKGDAPFVAKISSIWQETGGLMMSVFWYYRKEDTDKANSLQFVNMEVMASQHHDDISVACIDDKCHVLGLTEFCRFKAIVERHSLCVPAKSFIIPSSVSKFNQTLSETQKFLLQSEVYLCYRAYNHITGKILKASLYK